MPVHDAGPDQTMPLPETGRYWIAYRFPTDKLAQRAWETMERECERMSCWRTKAPQQPPYTEFVVWAVAEEADRLTKGEEICQRYRGTMFTPPDPEIITALRLRRLNQALDAVERGVREGFRSKVRSPGGRVIHPDGTMHPFKKPQG